jgi:hypothetical protein
MYNDNNIVFLMEDKDEVNTTNMEIEKMVKEFEELEIDENDDFILNYDFILNQEESQYNKELFYKNYTIKDLLKICNYYDIEKEIKSSKYKKQDIIYSIIYFESLKENYEIYKKRERMWYIMEQLKSDDKMRKYVYWN